MATAIAVLAQTTAGWAGGTEDYGCANATLKGEYAFGVTAYTPPGLPNGPPRVVTGIKVFDGKGNLTQRDYQGDNLAGPDFAPPGQERGTYTVNSDCTGSMVINLNAPVPSGSTGVIDIMFGSATAAAISTKSFHSSFQLDLPIPSPPRAVLTTGRSRPSKTTESRIDLKIETIYPGEEVWVF